MAIKLEFATEEKEPATSLLESATFFPRSTRLRGFAREGIKKKLAEFLDDS